MLVIFFELLANAVYGYFARYLTYARLALFTMVGGVGLLAETIQHDGITGGESWMTFLPALWRVWFAFSAGVWLFQTRRHLPRFPVVLAPVLAICFVVILVLPFGQSWSYDPMCVFLIFPLVVALGAGVQMERFGASLCLFVGRLSYPLYFLHYPFIKIVGYYSRLHTLSGWHLAFLAVVTIFGVIAFSALCMLYVDEPLRSWLVLSAKARRINAFKADSLTRL